MGLAMPVGCLSVRDAWKDSAGWSGRGHSRWKGSWRAKVFLPADLRELSGLCTGLYVAVRRIGGADGPVHVHIADSAPATTIIQCRFRRSDAVWRCRQERSVKPSAQPTLVRTQHLPPPA